MNERPNRTYITVILIVVFGVILAAGLGGVAGGLAGYYAAGRRALPTPQTIVERVEVAAATPQGATQGNAPLVVASEALTEEALLETLYERVNPSVVYISVAVPARAQGFPFSQGQSPYQYGSGSGFVYDRQGHIVTNNHVVEGAERIEVTFSDDTTLPATVVGRDPDSDLAVIKVDPEGLDLVAVELGDSDALRVGQKVLAIGNPFGYQGTLTTGVISGLSRSLPASAAAEGGSYTIPDVIQTDAAINPGNSGGPLLDYQGRVIGVNAAIESSTNSSAGVGFAIPVSLVKLVVPVLIESGTYAYPYLGISGGTIYPDVAVAMGLPRNQRGALVATVTPGGPADQAGVRASGQTTTIDGVQVPMGGDIIVALNGHPVNKFDDLIVWLIRETAPGDKATLTVLRDGKTIDLTVTLAGRPK